MTRKSNSSALKCWKRFLFDCPFVLLILWTAGCATKWDTLSKPETETLHRILDHWETWVPERQKDGTAPLMTFEELYEGLAENELKFLDRVRAIHPKKSFGFQGEFLGLETGNTAFRRLDGQEITRAGERRTLDPQYLPEEVYRSYEQMMRAMKKELGKRLWVESGYRSPAYQLYNFLFYLPKHHDSLVETGHWVALPGYSEHGAPQHQAIDFMNEEGINGEERVEDFEALPEYAWLQKNAGRFGFELSYPRGKKGITFEPWHWRRAPREIKA